jgi:hypothetical protein
MTVRFYLTVVLCKNIFNSVCSIQSVFLFESFLDYLPASFPNYGNSPLHNLLTTNSKGV